MLQWMEAAYGKAMQDPTSRGPCQWAVHVGTGFESFQLLPRKIIVSLGLGK